MLVRRVVLVLVAGLLVAAGLQGPSARAASLSVVMQSGGSGAANRWIPIGQSLAFSVTVTGGSPASIRWRVEDTTVATVTGTDTQATVTAVREGVTRLWVDVTASDGEIVSDSCWVSVAVDVPDTAGAVVLRGAALYRSRTTQATSRGVLGSNATATVLLTSGAWIRVLFAADFTFPQDDDEPGRDAWVLASSVDIPPTSVTLDADYLTLALGDAADLTASVLQPYANDYELAWASSNTGVAQVDDGTVTGAREGTATITAKAASSHGVTVSDTATASVYTPVGEETFGVTTSGVDLRRAASTTAPSAGSLPTGMNVEVTGVLGSWFYVSAGAVEGFLPASAVSIPVTELLLNRTSVAVKPGDALTVGATVVPSLATDAGVTWSSANPKIATVTSGKVSGVKVGSTTVTATAGGKSVTIPVGVSLGAPPARDAAPPDLAPTSSTLRLASMGANQATLKGYGWGQGTSRYQLQHRVAGGSYRNVTAAFTGSLTAVKTLTAGFDKGWLGKSVSYRLVKLTPAQGETAYSNTVTVTAGKPVLTARAASGKAVRLQWGVMSGVKGYRIEAKNSKGTWVKVAHMTKASSATRQVTKIGSTSLKEGKTYSFRLVPCTKVSATSCTQLKTAAKKAKALWSGTAQARTLPWKARVSLAGTEITKMLKGTTKAGGPLYLKGTNIHTTALGKNAAHPYVKFVWDAKAGVLELHAFLKFVQNGTKPEGSRSAGAMKKLFLEGVQQVWGNHVMIGSTVDFALGAEFGTKVVVHDWSNHASEKHAATQMYLEIHLGGAPSCVPNWYAACTEASYHGFKPDSAPRISIPWDDMAMVGNKPLREYNPKAPMLGSVGFRLTSAHEFGHALGLNDAYTLTYAPDNTKPADKIIVDRMMENDETTNNVGNTLYANLMKSDSVYIVSGKLAAVILEPNDYEMVLASYGLSSAWTPDTIESSEQSYASFIIGSEKHPISCEIVDKLTDKQKNGPIAEGRDGWECR